MMFDGLGYAAVFARHDTHVASSLADCVKVQTVDEELIATHHLAQATAFTDAHRAPGQHRI